jgi:hypothetical protein
MAAYRYFWALQKNRKLGLVYLGPQLLHTATRLSSSCTHKDDNNHHTCSGVRTHMKTREKQEDCKKREGRTRNRSTEQKRRRWKAVRKKTSGRRRKYEMGKPLDLVKHSIECPPLFTLISLLALS